MFVLRYKLHTTENAMLERTGDKIDLLAWYRANWQEIVFCQLWHSQNGFCYTIV